MASRSRPGPARTLGLAALGAYGASTAVIGILVAVGFGPGPAPARVTLTEAARQVTAAPVLPATLPTPTGAAARGRAVPSAVPSAQVGKGTAAGSPFRPTTLSLPGGPTAPVIASGVHQDGSLVIPDDPSTVGWWTGGALAGDPFGGVVLAGHVDSARYGLGVMARLKTLAVGQLVELRAGPLRMKYRVTVRREYPQAELVARSDAFRQDVPHRLVLITCGGAFDPVRHRYQDNVIIFADPLV
jgi:hypothetical protein